MTLDEFKAMCREEFAFLVEEFGFTEVPVTGEFTNPFSVRFEKDCLRVQVEGINWGRGVNIKMGKLPPPSEEHPICYFR